MSDLVNMHDAKSNLSQLIERVLAGEEITIARNGEPLVDLVIHKKPLRKLGFAKDLFLDLQDDFDLDAEPPLMDWDVWYSEGEFD